LPHRSTIYFFFHFIPSLFSSLTTPISVFVFLSELLPYALPCLCCLCLQFCLFYFISLGLLSLLYFTFHFFQSEFLLPVPNSSLASFYYYTAIHFIFHLPLLKRLFITLLWRNAMQIPWCFEEDRFTLGHWLYSVSRSIALLQLQKRKYVRRFVACRLAWAHLVASF
jgi:hypothetical protein